MIIQFGLLLIMSNCSEQVDNKATLESPDRPSFCSTFVLIGLRGQQAKYRNSGMELSDIIEKGRG